MLRFLQTISRPWAHVFVLLIRFPGGNAAPSRSSSALMGTSPLPLPLPAPNISIPVSILVSPRWEYKCREQCFAGSWGEDAFSVVGMGWRFPPERQRAALQLLHIVTNTCPWQTFLFWPNEWVWNGIFGMLIGRSVPDP